MLRQLRSSEKMKRVLWYGLLILIIPSMVAFYGVSGDFGGPVGGSGGTIATITFPDGTKREVGPQEVRFAENYHKGRLGQYAQSEGVMLDRLAISELSDRRTILDQAVNMEILKHYGESNGLTATTDEVNAQYQAQFTVDQRRMIAEQWARQGATVEQMLEEQRRGLLLTKSAENLSAHVRVTHFEAWQDYLKSGESLVADFVRFNPTDHMTSVTVTDEGVAKYYEENTEEFRTPDQVQYEYVMVSREDLKSSITLTEDQVTSYYASQQEDFRLPRKAEVSQIFLQLPTPEELNTTSAEALTSITEAVSTRANEIYERAAKGEDFAQLAATFNEETNLPPRADAENTTSTDALTTGPGYLGLVSEDVTRTWYGAQWTSAVFSMQPDGITRPIRTPRGFGIVQVKNVIEGDLQPLEDVRQIIESRLRDSLVDPIFEERGREIQQIVDNVTTLEQVARETSTTVRVTPKVNLDEQFIQGIGMLGELEEAVHDLPPGVRSDVLSDSQRHLIIQIKEEFPTHIPPLEDVRGRVEQAFRRSEAEAAARAKAEEVLEKSTDFASFEQAVKDAQTTITKTRPFTRPQVSGIFGGVAPGFAKESAGVSEGDIRMTTLGQPGQQKSFVVWHVASVDEPSKTEFANNLEEITARLEERKREIMVLEYIRDQRQKLTDSIEIEPGYL